MKRGEGIFFSNKPNFNDALTAAYNNTKDLNFPAGYHVQDFFNSHAGKLSWWHKSIGTMYNLAERSPEFKRVYDAAQNFISDTSYYANRAADLAPNILPKMESLRDALKTAISFEDNKAVGKPVFEGTLNWTRDFDGSPIQVTELEKQTDAMTVDQKSRMLMRKNKVSEVELKAWLGSNLDIYDPAVNNRFKQSFLKPGIVWTDAELKGMHRLSAEQISLYKEFRLAVDKSLNDMAISTMLSVVGKDATAVREEAMNASNIDEAESIIREHLIAEAGKTPNRHDVLMAAAEKMSDISARTDQLTKRGYAPLSRFGSYTLDVLNETGDRIYFGMFESKAESSKMARKMRQTYPQAKINQGTVSQEAYKLFSGVSPETVALFGDMLGLDETGDSEGNKAYQMFLQLATSSRSAMKRLIERKGIAGYSEDVTRVLAGFVYSNARHTSKNLHMAELGEAVANIPKGQGELQDAAVQLKDYLQNPREEAQAIKGLMFAQFIGGSLASAAVNLTQPFTMTMPYLSQFGGMAQSSKQMVAAVKDALKSSTGDVELDKAIKKAEADGIVSPQEVHQLMKQAAGKAALQSGDGTLAGTAQAKWNNSVSRFSVLWGAPFSIAEQLNRRITFIASWRIAKAQGMIDPMEFAKKAISESQGIYNKANKPKWARGAIGGTLFTFKQYSVAYNEMLHRMWTQGGPDGKRAVLYSLAVLVLLSGFSGLPFKDDLDDLISGLMQKLGYNFDSKSALRSFLADYMGQTGARLLLNGISGLPGAPIDISGRMGLGNLIPGTGLLTKKEDHTRDVLEFAGPAGDMFRRFFSAADNLLSGDLSEAIQDAGGTAVNNLIKAQDMISRGMYRNVKGQKVIETTVQDAFFKAIGFQPNDVKRAQDATEEKNRLIGLNKLKSADISDKWAIGIFEEDQKKIAEAKLALTKWNESNPDTPIRINMTGVWAKVRNMRMSKEERIVKTAPKSIRQQVRRDLEEQL